jgi:hypothetical protein
MDASSLIGILQPTGSVVISVVSVFLSIVAIRATLRAQQAGRNDQNYWETYRWYNSADIQRGRSAARALAKDPNWERVLDYAAYRVYFRLDEPTGGVSDSMAAVLRDDEKALHHLMGYYHQLGMLLLHMRMLDRDFTMLLVGEGLSDLWEVLGRIPGFFPNYPYSGMYELYYGYLDWVKARFPKLVDTSAQRRRAAAVLSSMEMQPS